MGGQCQSVGWWRDRQYRRSRGRTSIPRSIPEGEKLCVRETTNGARGAVAVWVARIACGEAAGSVARASGPRGKASGQRPGAGGHHTSRRDRVVCAKRLLSENPAAFCSENPAACLRAWECEGCGHGPGGVTRAGPPSGGPVQVRSIRKNHVLPGSGPTDLHYGKNGYVRCSVRWVNFQQIFPNSWKHTSKQCFPSRIFVLTKILRHGNKFWLTAMLRA